MKICRLILFFMILILTVSPSIAQTPFDFKNPRIPFSDQGVEKAIDKAVQYLLSSQQADGSWPAPVLGSKDKDSVLNCKIGTTSLVLYALMEKGLSFQNEKIAKGLKWLADTAEVLDGRNATYGISFRCQAWLRAWKQAKDSDKTAASKYRKCLETDVAKFVKEKDKQFNGGYSYALTESRFGDNSNSQYGVLAVWAGYRAGMEIPKEYWEKVMKYWIPQQRPDGGWNYAENEPAPTASMTAAGIATLFVCIDALKGQEFIKCNVATEFAPVKKGLDWYDANFKQNISMIQRDRDMFYTLYGIERIGLASGYKYFGDADWYKHGVVCLLNLQGTDGSWKNSNYGPDVSTSYALLFLIRGQHGVLFNRIEYNGDWNNRPRALANFCRWAENAYEHEVNWQIITLKSEVGEWHDAPVVLITGST
ncbi:MAG: terpene cyclase/mutase family protein, partial [Planctomycetes bacterium]|nr:terpene cyclase/mutase family protein [Planctomycetota bacterium]